jgi:lysine biosynthesis protein LysW
MDIKPVQKRRLGMAIAKALEQGYCIDCDASVYFAKRPTLRQQVVCPECGAYLEVVKLNPVAMDWSSAYFMSNGNGNGNGNGDDDDDYEYDDDEDDDED